jgi:hypothetical protein
MTRSLIPSSRPVSVEAEALAAAARAVSTIAAIDLFIFITTPRELGGVTSRANGRGTTNN